MTRRSVEAGGALLGRSLNPDFDRRYQYFSLDKSDQQTYSLIGFVIIMKLLKALPHFSSEMLLVGMVFLLFFHNR